MKETRPKREEFFFCLERLLNKIQEKNPEYLYIGAPPATGKTTLLLKLEEREGGDFLFLQLEHDDKEPLHLLRTFGEILSKRSLEFMEYYEDIKNFSVRPLFIGFQNILKRIKLPEYTYVIMNLSALEEKAEEIICNYILPLIKLIDKKRFIIEGYEDYLPFLPDYFEIYNSEDLKLNEEEVNQIAEVYGVKILPNEVFRILEFTEGWIFPTILIIKQIQEGKTLESVLKDKEGFKQIFEETIETLEDRDKRLLYAISQFIKFDEDLVKEILDIKNFREILKKWERKGIYVGKRKENGRFFLYLNPVLKKSIDEYIFRLKGGEIIYFLLHSKASEYFARRGDFPSAVYHAVKAMKLQDASRYLSYSIFDLIEEHRFIFLEDLFQEIGYKKIQENPSLAMYYSIYLCSRRKYEEAYKILEKIKDEILGREKITWYYYYSLTRMYVKSAKEAGDLVKTGIEILEKFPVEYTKEEYEKKWYYRMKGSFYNLRGLINRRLFKYEEAEKDFKEAISFFDKIGNKKISNNLKNNLIHIYLNLGKIKECEQLIEELLQEKGSWTRIAYLYIALLEMVFRENLKKAEKYLEKYLKFSQKYELRDGYCYYYSLKFTIEGVYRNEIEKSKKILDEFERFVRENNMSVWETYLYIHKIEFSFINASLDEINDYLRILNVKKLNEDTRKFFDFYSALYAYLMRYDRDSIFKYLNELIKNGNVLDTLYLSRFLARILKDFRDENAEKVMNEYLTLREKYVSSL